MGEKRFGTLNGRELLLRWRAPLCFCIWNYKIGFQFSWRALLSWRNWLSAIRQWRFRCHRYHGSNHRCYCPVGYSIDGGVTLCGFWLGWWYQNYNGPVPCNCDKVLAELRAENGDD